VQRRVGERGKKRDGQPAGIAERQEEDREKNGRAGPLIQRPRLPEADHGKGRDVAHEEVGGELRARAILHSSHAYVGKMTAGDRLEPGQPDIFLAVVAGKGLGQVPGRPEEVPGRAEGRRQPRRRQQDPAGRAPPPAGQLASRLAEVPRVLTFGDRRAGPRKHGRQPLPPRRRLTPGNGEHPGRRGQPDHGGQDSEQEGGPYPALVVVAVVDPPHDLGQGRPGPVVDGDERERGPGREREPDDAPLPRGNQVIQPRLVPSRAPVQQRRQAKHRAQAEDG
jgi:hypothetical protein